MQIPGKKLAVIGTVFQAGPLVGLLGLLIGWFGAYETVEHSPDAAPEALKGDIFTGLFSVAGGLVVSGIGVALILIALLGYRYRGRWFRNVLFVMSILWLLAFPFGTAGGTAMIIYLIRHQDEFKRYRDQSKNNNDDQPPGQLPPSVTVK